MFELLFIGLILYWIFKPSKADKIRKLTRDLRISREENKELRNIILNREFTE